MWPRTVQDSAAGVVAGSIGAVVGHPFDCVKVFAQLEQHRTTRAACASILRQHGPLGFFKGLSAPLLGRAIVSGIAFGSYETIRDYLLPFNKEVASNVLAESVAMPLDAVKSFVQARQADRVRHLGLRGLFKGTVPALARALPVHLTTMAAYERLRHRS